jgi:3-hydroxyacyl-CoA dehydrogenase
MMYTCSQCERNEFKETQRGRMADLRSPTEPVVAVIGAGSIGAAFAIVFAAAGCAVRLHDPDARRRAALLSEIALQLDELAGHGLTAEPAAAAMARINLFDKQSEALAAATYVQECAPETLELKRKLFAEMEREAEEDAILASSSSAIPASQFAGELASRRRCLVVHPGNPPTLLRIAEVVPAPFTGPAIVRRAIAFLQGCGLAPILVRREVEGFVFNRLQGALLREAYCLVRDGVATVEDIDQIVRDGLGLRWSVIGPFETADLNTRGGILSHAKKMGPAYQRMGAERGQNDPWTPELVADVAAARRKVLPLDGWEERVAWRDRALMRLVRDRQARSQ